MQNVRRKNGQVSHGQLNHTERDEKLHEKVKKSGTTPCHLYVSFNWHSQAALLAGSSKGTPGDAKCITGVFRWGGGKNKEVRREQTYLFVSTENKHI